MAFYASAAQYERYFAACGFDSEARTIAQAAQAQDNAAMLRVCPDDMVETSALVGSVDEVRARAERIAPSADSFTLCTPFYGLSLDQVSAYKQRTAEAFYG